ncbi:MAG: DUF87 domain-containing protein, partial [Clostridia bacterium]|nr:DUF87 domain-containing protein [Clostridia bacterium]
VHLTFRSLGSLEENRVWQTAERNRRFRESSRDVSTRQEARGEEKDILEVLENERQEGFPLCEASGFLEVSGETPESLEERTREAMNILSRARVRVDRLLLRQKAGLECVRPGGRNVLGKETDRILPSLSFANLYPFHSGCVSDERGLSIGREASGETVSVDFDLRDTGRTNGNILVLGNSGEGKSYLCKLLLCRLRESGHRLIVLDAEGEYLTLTRRLSGRILSPGSGGLVNPLSFRTGNKGDGSEHLRQLSFIRDFFSFFFPGRPERVDLAVHLVRKLYEERNISPSGFYEAKDFPDLSDLEEISVRLYREGKGKETVSFGDLSFPREILREVCLTVRSLVSSGNRYFDRPTPPGEEKMVTYDLREVMGLGSQMKEAILFSLVHNVSDKLLSGGRTVCLIDEMYLYLSGKGTVRLLRDDMKRVRKVGSSLILASQNSEDFFLPEIREMTGPLFSIPSHQFLFHPGATDLKSFSSLLSLDEREVREISSPRRGHCLYRCGNRKFALSVEAPEELSSLWEESMSGG